MENSEYCKFTLQLLKHINKNSCKGPLTDKAAQEAGFGKTERRDNFMDGILDIKGIDMMSGATRAPKKTRSFSLGGDEKEHKAPKVRHNSPIASGRRLGLIFPPINVSRLDKGSPKPKRDSLCLNPEAKDEKSNLQMRKNKTSDANQRKKDGDEHQSTDEEDKGKIIGDIQEGDLTNQQEDLNDFALIKERLEKGLTKSNKKEEIKEKLNDWEAEELKKQFDNLPEGEKEIKEELKEETLELIWKLSHESSVIQGANFSVHKGAIETVAFALNYNSDEVKWKYVTKIMEKLRQNESVISMISILKKFIQTFPEGDINKIRNPPDNHRIDELAFPKTRIELIKRLDRDFALMNEIMSLNIEFKRTTLDLIYDHLGRNMDREQSLETQSSLSSQTESEGEDTEEEGDVQTDAGSHPSQNSHNLNEDKEETDDNDIELKSGSKQQALSEDDGFIVPKKREIRNNMLSGRHSNNGDEEEKENKRGANQSLSITDMSMTDEDNKEKDLDRRLTTKRSHSVSHQDPTARDAIPESPVHNYRENDFILNVQTNAVYKLKYFKEIEERLEFIKYLLKNSDETIKPVHIKILWECHIDSSFHERERAIFLDWLSSIIKIQSGYANTRREAITIFDDDTIELIFFESLL